VIAAVLQTAGVYSQSEILKNFSTFFDSLGVLFVIASMMGGIASVVFFSAYKRGLMLLLCPFLFMFVMKTTVTGRPTIVRIGERFTSATDSQFQSVLQEWLINKNNAAPQVSLVYVLFDSAVSSVMQSMVAMLTDTKNKEDLIAIARERVLVNVLSSKAMSPELLKLVSIGLVGQCGELTRLHSEANQARVDQLRIAELDKDIKRAGGSGGLNRIQRIDEKVAFRNSRIVEAKKKMFVLDPDVRLYILGVIDSYKQELAKKNTAEGNALLTAVGELRSNLSIHHRSVFC
jgi:hypothetical protein